MVSTALGIPRSTVSLYHCNRFIAVITKTMNDLGIANALTLCIKSPTTTGTGLLNTIRSGGFELLPFDNGPKNEAAENYHASMKAENESVET
jgi:hypothetical protein